MDFLGLAEAIVRPLMSYHDEFDSRGWSAEPGASSTTPTTAVGRKNQELTEDLVRAKHEWVSEQTILRANAHGRFVYQTALARIVARVRACHHDNRDDDDGDDENDEGGGGGDGRAESNSSSSLSSSSCPMVQDILRWVRECEHLTVAEPAAVQQRPSPPSSDGGGGGEGGGDNPHHRRTVIRGRPHPPAAVADHRGAEDVAVLPALAADFDAAASSSSMVRLVLSTRTLPTSIPVGNGGPSLEEQNRALLQEIANWTDGTARVRAANEVEVRELLAHQRTLQRVVERVRRGDGNGNGNGNCGDHQTPSSSSSSSSQQQQQLQQQLLRSSCVADVDRWYEECQKEAAKSGCSVSPQEGDSAAAAAVAAAAAECCPDGSDSRGSSGSGAGGGRGDGKGPPDEQWLTPPAPMQEGAAPTAPADAADAAAAAATKFHHQQHQQLPPQSDDTSSLAGKLRCRDRAAEKCDGCAMM